MTQRYIKEDTLKNVFRKNQTSGKGYNFSDSLDLTIRTLRRNLEDISNGQYNGMPIKDSSNIASHLEVILAPALKAAQALRAAVSENKGWGTVTLTDAEETILNHPEINLIEAGDKLKDAVNEWLTFIKDRPEMSPQPGLPLAINDPARLPGIGIHTITDIVSYDLKSKSFVPAQFITNEQARTMLESYKQEATPAILAP